MWNRIKVRRTSRHDGAGSPKRTKAEARQHLTLRLGNLAAFIYVESTALNKFALFGLVTVEFISVTAVNYVSVRDRAALRHQSFASSWLPQLQMSRCENSVMALIQKIIDKPKTCHRFCNGVYRPTVRQDTGHP